MKPKLLRALTLASFLIFLLPFVQYCSRGVHKIGPAIETEVTVDTVAVLPPPPPAKDKTLVAQEATAFPFKSQESHSPLNGDQAWNAYEYSYIIFNGPPKLSDFKEIASYITVCYNCIIILSVFMVGLAFKRHYKTVLWLAVANIALLLSSTFIHYTTGDLLHWWQIKYGYYLFIVNMIAIVWLSANVTPGVKASVT
jgi:hypothetical protein